MCAYVYCWMFSGCLFFLTLNCILRCVILISKALSSPWIPAGSSENDFLWEAALFILCGAGTPWHMALQRRRLRRPALAVLLLMPVYQITESQAAFLRTRFLLPSWCNPAGCRSDIAVLAELWTGTSETQRVGSSGPGLCVDATKCGGDVTSAVWSTSELQPLETKDKNHERTHWLFVGLFLN